MSIQFKKRIHFGKNDECPSIHLTPVENNYYFSDTCSTICDTVHEFESISWSSDGVSNCSGGRRFYRFEIMLREQIWPLLSVVNTVLSELVKKKNYLKLMFIDIYGFPDTSLTSG